MISEEAKVKDIMDKNFAIVDVGILLKVAIKVMLFSMKDYLVVKDKNNCIGYITRDAISKLNIKGKYSDRLTIKKIIVKDFVRLDDEDSVMYASSKLVDKKHTIAIVMRDKEVKGIVTIDMIQKSSSKYFSDIYNITEKAFDNVVEAICICDANGKVVYWNKASEKLYDLKKKDIIGTNILNFFPNALTTTVFREKNTIKDVLHEPVKGKEVFLSAVPIFNAEGSMIAVVTMDRDAEDMDGILEKLNKEKEKTNYYKDRYDRQMAKQYSFSSVISRSKNVLDAIEMSQKVAPTHANVMITGDSGTGKDVFARAIHRCSQRKGPYVAVNCSAIPEELLESELFGYDQGAFTGAIKGGKKGKFELANNGTLFLDEIGEMPLKMQSKLLRILQDGIITPLGSHRSIKTDARIISATNIDIAKAIEDGKFREDLFYRLAVVNIDLPPLKDRKEDIKDLTKYFIKTFAEQEDIKIVDIEESVFDVFVKYAWPGNIRELRNVVQRMVILSNNGKLDLTDVPPYIINVKKSEENQEMSLNLDKEVNNLEIMLLKKALAEANGNKTKAAKLLGINRTTFYYKLNFYGMSEGE